MLRALADESTPQARKDALAMASAPYCHPRLNAVASLGVPANSCPPLEVRIISVPRGGQYNSKTDKIEYADGTEADPPPFVPFAPTPDYPPEPKAEPAPAPAEPLPVFEPEAEDDDKIELLDAHRRRRDDDETSGAA
jgi:hypothetical protein